MAETTDDHFKCTCEGAPKIKSLKSMCAHIQYKHYERDADDRLYFVCPAEDCPESKFYGFQNIKRHFDRHHFFDARFSCLFDKESANAPAVQNNSEADNLGQNSVDRSVQQLPDLDDGLSDVSMDCDDHSTPILLIDQHFKELRLEDKLCDLIIKHKKIFPTTTVKASLDIADEWRKFYTDYLESGKTITKLFPFINSISRLTFNRQYKQRISIRLHSRSSPRSPSPSTT